MVTHTRQAVLRRRPAVRTMDSMSGARILTGSHESRWETPYRLELPGEAAGEMPSMLVALHGWGEDAEAFSARLRFGAEVPFARLFLSGPFPVIVGEGDTRRVGRSWYSYTGDQAAFSKELKRGEEDLMGAIDEVRDRHDLDAGRTLLLGYSQGGYLAAYAALRNRERFAGLVSVSCRVKTELLDKELLHAVGYPVLCVHGERDRGVELAPQREAVEKMRSAGLDVRLHTHAGGHGLKTEVLPVIEAFVREVLTAD